MIKKIVKYTCFIVAFIFFWCAVASSWNYIIFLKHSKAIEATISGITTDCSKIDTDGNCDHIVYVNYYVNNSTYINTIGYYSSDMTMGQKIKIYYDVNNPAIIKYIDFFAPIIVFSFGMVSLFVGIIDFKLNKKKTNKVKWDHIQDLSFGIIPVFVGIVLIKFLGVISIFFIAVGMVVILTDENFLKKFRIKHKKIINIITNLFLLLLLIGGGLFIISISINIVAILVAVLFILSGINLIYSTFFKRNKEYIFSVNNIIEKNNKKYVIFDDENTSFYRIRMFLGINYQYMFKTESDIFKVGNIYKVKLYKYGGLHQMFNNKVFLTDFVLDDFVEYQQ